MATVGRSPDKAKGAKRKPLSRTRIRALLAAPHVVEEDGQWRVVRMDARRASSLRFQSEHEAVRHAKKRCPRKKGVIYVHPTKGKVRQVPLDTTGKTK